MFDNEIKWSTILEEKYKSNAENSSKCFIGEIN
jgi:hypothetical protein